MSTALPRIIVTSGEPAGIGPDLCIQLAQRPCPCALAFAVDPTVIADRARQLGQQIQLQTCTDVAKLPPHSPGSLWVLPTKTDVPVVAGKLDSGNARYVLRLLDLALQNCIAGHAHAMVTAPVQKSAIIDAGIPFIGHTEYLAEQTGALLPVMMLASNSLRVALATTHIPLKDVPAAITPQLLEQVLLILDHDLKLRFGFSQPRIMVCGLNPHAGESGHLGREEMEVIEPTMQRMRARGLNLIGPVPADTAFTPRQLQRCDAVLAMFHDQGLPPLKQASFGEAVNVTLGIPIIRTSVDHGTALDLAGTGKAEVGSLIAALEMAIELAKQQLSRTGA